MKKWIRLKNRQRNASLRVALIGGVGLLATVGIVLTARVARFESWPARVAQPAPTFDLNPPPEIEKVEYPDSPDHYYVVNLTPKPLPESGWKRFEERYGYISRYLPILLGLVPRADDKREGINKFVYDETTLPSFNTMEMFSGTYHVVLSTQTLEEKKYEGEWGVATVKKGSPALVLNCTYTYDTAKNLPSRLDSLHHPYLRTHDERSIWTT